MPLQWLILGGFFVTGGDPSGGLAVARQVPWWGEVQRSETAPTDAPPLSPLFSGPAEALTRDQWRQERQTRRQAWNAFLGPPPAAPAESPITVRRSDEVDGVRREFIEYEVEPQQTVQAYLLRPTAAAEPRSRPGLVALHQTTAATIDEIAGVAGRDEMQLGIKLARRGFVVICPRCFLWQDVQTLPEAVERFRTRHPHSLGMRKMLFDAQRAVDLLAAQPDVDPRRLGAIGHSLGAKEVLYLAAFDERIRAAVASEGGVGFSFTNWDAPWYLGPAIREPGFPRHHHELIAMTAPRALLIVAGESGPGAADGERTWPYLQAALPIYRLFESRPKLGLLNHRAGHAIPPAAFERMAEWLTTYLEPVDAAP